MKLMTSTPSLFVAVTLASALFTTQSWARSHRADCHRDTSRPFTVDREDPSKPWECSLGYSIVSRGKTEDEARVRLASLCMASPENLDIQWCAESSKTTLCFFHPVTEDTSCQDERIENNKSRDDSEYSEEDQVSPSRDRMQSWSCRFANYLGTGMSQDAARTALSSSCMVQGMPATSCSGYASAASCSSN